MVERVHALLVHDRVLVRHLVAAQDVHGLQLPVLIYRDVNVELRFQREVLLLLSRHKTPDNLHDRVVELKVHRELLLAQLLRNEHLLILLDVQHEHALDEVDLLEASPEVERPLQVAHLEYDADLV